MTSKTRFKVPTAPDAPKLFSVGELVESEEIGDEILHRARNITKRFGHSTGYKALDNLLRGGGVLPGLLYICAGRPGMGKTTFLLNLAHNFAAQEIPTVVFSLELNNLRLVERLAYQQSGIDYMEHWRTQSPLDAAEMERLEDALARLRSLPLFAKDTTGMTPGDVVRTMEYYGKTLGLKVMLIDYLHIMRPDDRVFGSREREIGVMVERIRDVAKNLNVTCILACQLNREVEESAPYFPMLRHLRDSGAIEQVAYSVWALYRKDYYVLNGMLVPDDEAADGIITLDNTLNVCLLKQQDGPTGTASLQYRAGVGKVSDFND